MSLKSKYDLFINGQFVEPSSGQYVDSTDPHDQSVIAQTARAGIEDMELAVRAASDAQTAWKNLKPLERGKILTSIGRGIEENLELLAKTESRDMGMPVGMAMMTIQGAANYYQYYGGLAPCVEGANIPVGPDQHSYTIYDPYGVVGVITPWNVPMNQSARSIAPALAVGNTIVHKPAECSSLASLILCEIMQKAGLPDGVLNLISGSGRSLGPALAKHPKIGKIAFTGSVGVGEELGEIAGRKIMPITLELGGKSANIIFEDADLAAAVPGAMMAFISNTGQICTSGTRVLVQRSIYDQFSKAIAGAIQTVPIGRENPFPTLGPIANKSQYETVLEYIEIGKQEGAELLAGGEKATGEGLDKGFYIKPTVFGNVNNSMRIAREEIFGPVGALIPFDTEEEAIAIANDSDFGLAGGVWTRDISRAHRVAQQMETGQIFVNYYFDGGPESPLGGYKKSGIGREKGIIAMTQYTHLKNISIKLT